MNVLFINSSRGWGGGEVWLAQMCGGLMHRGHAVAVACREDSELVENLRRSSIEVIPLRSWGDFSPSSIRRLFHVIKTMPVDIVCTNWEKDLRLGGLAACLAGVPIIPSREIDRPIKNSWMNRIFYKYIASAVLVNSFATYETLLKSAPWLSGKQIEIIWKGVEGGYSESFSAANLKTRFHLHDDDVIAGFVGRLDEQKGVWTLLEAMRLALKRTPQLKLLFAGDGNLHVQVQEYLREYGLMQDVFLMGFVENVAPVLKAIDFLVMPSNWEGFGYSAIEAMAMGKAVVGTTASSLPEIIKDGETGILIPPRSPEQLAAAMEYLGTDATRRNQLGEAGLLRAKEQFSLSQMIEKTEHFFLDVIHPYRPGSNDAPLPTGLGLNPS